MTKTGFRAWPWWLKVLLVFIAGRLVSTAMLLILAAQQPENAWTAASPDLFDFSNIWDGRWYDIVAEAGYPAQLPLTDDGFVDENAWAFLPLFPALMKVIMMLTGATWAPTAVVVSLVFGLGTTLILYKMLARVVSSQQALFAVVLFSVAPVSPLLQLGYAESMFFFFVALALYLLMQKKYLWIIPVAFAMSFTRPGALALTLTMFLTWCYRFFRRKKHRFSRRESISLIVATALTTVFGFAWMVIAGLVTGVPDAYLKTELAWRSVYIGHQELGLFQPWIQSSQWWLPGITGYLVLAALVAAFAVFLFLPATKRLGVELRFWGFSYALYLLAVFFPQSSTFRVLAPLFPLLGAVAAPKSKIYRVFMVVLFIALQWGWLLIAWRVDGYDWTPA